MEHFFQTTWLRKICFFVFQVAILQNLVEQNQAQCASRSMSSAEAQFSSDLDVPISTGRESSCISEVALTNSEMESSKTSGEDRDIYTELSSLHSLEGFCDVESYLICNSPVNQHRPYTAKRLHLPFVMLATNPDA